MRSGATFTESAVMHGIDRRHRVEPRIGIAAGSGLRWLGVALIVAIALAFLVTRVVVALAHISLVNGG